MNSSFFLTTTAADLQSLSPPPWPLVIFFWCPSACESLYKVKFVKNNCRNQKVCLLKWKLNLLSLLLLFTLVSHFIARQHTNARFCTSVRLSVRHVPVLYRKFEIPFNILSYCFFSPHDSPIILVSWVSNTFYCNVVLYLHHGVCRVSYCWEVGLNTEKWQTEHSKLFVASALITAACSQQTREHNISVFQTLLVRH